MKVEDDAALLNTLGVTSANPEDIERNILEKARNDARGNHHESNASIKEEIQDGSSDIAPALANRKELYSKLRAVQIEIDAVASTVEQTKNAAKTLKQESDGVKEEDTEDDKGIYGSLNANSTLQHALAADRLKSLKRTRAQLRKELSNSSKDSATDVCNDEKVLQALVRDDSKLKGKLKQKQVLDSNKRPKKKSKAYSFDEDDDFDAALNAASGGLIETEREELIRKGILTPFHKLKGFERRIQQPGPSNASYEEDIDGHASSSAARVAQSLQLAAQARPTTILLDSQNLPKLNPPAQQFQSLRSPFKVPKIVNGAEGKAEGTKRKTRRPLPGERWRKRISREQLELEEGKSVPDDLVTHSSADNGNIEDEENNGPPYLTLEGGLKIPESVFDNLFDYQKVGVQWLWELHCQRAGGIIGDEMGLGKTVQVLSFIGALHFSGLYKPSIVVCPVTLLRQWKREAQKWYPDFHVEILHDSAVEIMEKKRKESDESEGEGETEHGSGESSGSDHEKDKSSRKKKKWDSLLKRVLRTNSGLLITTYEQLRIQGETLLNIEWGYAILDEGHRIRNPNADVTIVCKQLQTVHRIIMTGSPIQNKLTELWSLFDFVFPGKLGVLPVFEAEFAVPISVGGYANASPLQVSTAYRCAVVLRDLIMPYLLRRMKADVNAQLPKKTEHVLFCSLTPEQRTAYRTFLASSEVEQIFDGSRNSLYGIDVMRKICNHPDLLEREYASTNPDYGNPERSGKLKVVTEVLKMWKEQNHRVLLFAQTQQMLDILENFLISNDYSYRRMDGLTPVKHRMALIDEFNNSDDVFIFILTTKVGGLGTNLTGANRVIIFDPDWNPSTDMQARERAWRIGQKRDVTVFRLITRGTIEEKVYHRQIYKHFLTNKILKNPQQRRFFKSRDLKDLFVLDEDEDGRSTATMDLFGQVSAEVNVIGAGNANQRSTNSLTVGANGNIENDEDHDKSISSEDKDDGIQNGKEADEETGFLKSLFEAHGIHSAVNHDVIMNAHDDEKIRLEAEASRVAQRAAEALRQSRMLCSKESVAVPTWTGKSGAAGAPSTIRRKFGSTVNTQLLASPAGSSSTNSSPGAGGNSIIGAGAPSGKALSSSELLARIRGNQAVAMADGLEQQFGLASGPTKPSSGARSSRPPRNLSGVPPEVLIRQICTFMQERGGKTTSGSIVGHFKERIPPDSLALFKNLLKEIANLDKGPGGSFWVLKQEYQ